MFSQASVCPQGTPDKDPWTEKPLEIDPGHRLSIYQVLATAVGSTHPIGMHSCSQIITPGPAYNE